MPDALLIIDMQVGSFGPATPRYDAGGLVERLNALSVRVRAAGGVVVWVQHDGPPGDVHEPGSEGWRILPALDRQAGDETVNKTACDSFLGTRLEAILRERGVGRVIITGCATDFCVDTTVRACAAKGFETWAASDGHTTCDRPHLAAAKIIEHHNFIWSDFIAPAGPVSVVSCQALMPGPPGNRQAGDRGAAASPSRDASCPGRR
jgi:nicotinamidase-related amidase